MKIKIILLVLLLAVSAGLLSGCPPDTTDPIEKLDYAAKAREIVDDLYINDGTDEDAAKFAYIGSHFYTILDILGIGHVENPDEVTADSPVSMTIYQIDIITTSIYSDLSLNFSTTETETGKSYYPLTGLADFINNSGLQIEREAGYGPITGDELKGVMDYYTELYENNDTVEREYFAGYLIGAISKNNPDIGTTADQYSLDKLQLFLFLLDAFSLPADSPLAASVQTLTSKSAISISDNAGGSKSNWGVAANQLKIKQRTKQSVVPLLDSGLKTYTYEFELAGPQEIYCGTWKYTAHVTRRCTWSSTATSTIPPDGEEELAPLPKSLGPKDCRGVPQDVEGIYIIAEGELQEHTVLQCLDDDSPSGVFQTKSDGRNCLDALCKKACPPDWIETRKEGTTNVNGYVCATFSGFDKAVGNHRLIEVKVSLPVTERVGDELYCHEPKPE